MGFTSILLHQYTDSRLLFNKMSISNHSLYVKGYGYVAGPDYNMLWLLLFLTLHGFGIQRFKVQGSVVAELP